MSVTASLESAEPIQMFSSPGRHAGSGDYDVVSTDLLQDAESGRRVRWGRVGKRAENGSSNFRQFENSIKGNLLVSCRMTGPLSKGSW